MGLNFIICLTGIWIKNTTFESVQLNDLEMKIIYKKHDLYPDQILIREFEGIVDLNDIIGSWEYLIQNKMLNNKIKGIINDLSNCELAIDLEGFETLMTFMKNQDLTRGIKVAVVTNSPKTIVFPTLGEKQVSEFSIKPFTTIQAATDWVSKNI